MGSHLRCKIDDGNECEQVTEKVDKVRDEIEIVVENDGVKRGFFGNKFINVFRQVENNNDKDQQGDRIKKRTQEFLNNIKIDGFHRQLSSLYAVNVEKLSEPLG
jgi:hypothetical protein